MKKIYVLLMHTSTIPANFVKFMTGYKYSHVAISLDKSCSTIYSFGRKKINSILDAGFTVENKNGEFFKKFNNTYCKICELIVTEEQYENITNTIRFMESNEKMYKYDFIGTAFRYLNIPLYFENKYVCSYFIASLLEENNIYNFNKKSYFVKPKDFEKLISTNEIYTGMYNLYNQANIY